MQGAGQRLDERRVQRALGAEWPGGLLVGGRRGVPSSVLLSASLPDCFLSSPSLAGPAWRRPQKGEPGEANIGSSCGLLGQYAGTPLLPQTPPTPPETLPFRPSRAAAPPRENVCPRTVPGAQHAGSASSGPSVDPSETLSQGQKAFPHCSFHLVEVSWDRQTQEQTPLRKETTTPTEPAPLAAVRKTADDNDVSAATMRRRTPSPLSGDSPHVLAETLRFQRTASK